MENSPPIIKENYLGKYPLSFQLNNSIFAFITHINVPTETISEKAKETMFFFC